MALAAAMTGIAVFEAGASGVVALGGGAAAFGLMVVRLRWPLGVGVLPGAAHAASTWNSAGGSGPDVAVLASIALLARFAGPPRLMQGAGDE